VLNVWFLRLLLLFCVDLFVRAFVVRSGCLFVYALRSPHVSLHLPHVTCRAFTTRWLHVWTFTRLRCPTGTITGLPRLPVCTCVYGLRLTTFTLPRFTLVHCGLVRSVGLVRCRLVYVYTCPPHTPPHTTIVVVDSLVIGCCWLLLLLLLIV